MISVPCYVVRGPEDQGKRETQKDLNFFFIVRKIGCTRILFLDCVEDVNVVGNFNQLVSDFSIGFSCR